MSQQHEVSIAVTKMPTVYPQRWLAFAALALTVLIVVLDYMVLNVALPTLQREMNATISELQWIADAYILAFAALLMTMGALADRIGHIIMLRTGMFIFGIASLLAAFSGSAWQLVAARALMGLGAAMIVPSTLALISIIFPPEERGKAIGAWGAMNGLGVVLGPLLGGWLLEQYQWGSIFLINIPIIIISLIAGLFLIPKVNVRVKRHIDLPGTILSAITILLLVFGIIKTNNTGLLQPSVYGTLCGALIFGYCFFRWEKKTEAPMIDLALFKNPYVSSGSSSIALMAFSMYGFIFVLTLYMQLVKGYSPMQTGIRFLPLAIGYAMGTVSSSRNVQRWGTKSVITISFVGMAIASLFIAFWNEATPFLIIGLNVGLLSFFLGNIMAPSLNAVLGALPPSRAGVGSAIGSISLQVGGALGVAVLGSLLNGIYRFRMIHLFDYNILFPIQAIQNATESLGAALAVAATLPADIGQGLTSLARTAFMHGWILVFFAICCVSISGMFFTRKAMPSNIASSKKINSTVNVSNDIK